MKQTLLAFIIILIINAQSCFSQNNTEIVRLSEQEAIQDIDTLRKYIEEIHPNAYAFISKEKIGIEYKKVKNSINDSLTVYRFYHYLSYLAAQYGDGHLSILFPNSWYSANRNVIPFTIDINFIDRKLFVDKPDSILSIPTGAEIIEINGIFATEIIDTLLICQSGESIAFRAERSKRYFNELLYSIYNISNDYEIKYKYLDKIQIKTVKGISYTNYIKQLNKGVIKSNYKSKILPEHNTCIIDFHEFSDFDNFKIFLDSTFTLIQKQNIHNLIIDLRKNGGGNSSLGDELFQYIAKKPFSQYSKVTMKVSRHLKTLWSTYFLQHGWIDSLTLDSILIIPNGELTVSDDASLIQLRENPLRFSGNIYVLTSSKTFSSASDFAWCFQYYKMGKIIGEETGGWVVCYGDNVVAILPNSGIKISVSCKLFYNIGTTDKDTHGVIPDYQSQSEDALEYTIKLIKNEK